MASLLKYVQFTIALIVTLGSANAQLQADFTANLTSGCSPIIVHFQDISSGNPTQWKWDLGNGTNSVLQNPSVSYTTPGTYNIKLVIRNSAGADSIIKSQFITVFDNPNVNFSALPTTGCYPLNVQFTDLTIASSGTNTQWQWDFGNGNVSTVQNPSHTYLTQGSFNVNLKVTNSKGCFKVLTKSSFINVDGGVTANFTYVTSGNCQPPTPITFTNTSTGTGLLTYQWWFGDGVTSTQTNPIHSYTNSGSYTVTLITTNSEGCRDTIVKTNAINIGSVQANFIHPTTICAGTSVNFINTSTPATASSFWTFGDNTTSTQINASKIYTTAGSYQVKLINNFGACKDSITKTIIVKAKPLAAFSSTNNIACSAPTTVQFVNNTMGGESYLWNFGDGNTSTLQSPTHIFNSQGNFAISLIATNNNGCRDTLTKNNFVKITPPKIDSLVRMPKEGCVPLTVNLSAGISSIQNVASYQWNFGDGATSNQANPTHIYTTEGKFDVQLIITTVGGCKDTIKIINAVKVGHKPSANFEANLTDVCAFTGVAFTDLSTNGPIDSWQWSFGIGEISTLQNPYTQFPDSGYFSIKLIVSNNGCKDTMLKLNYIHVNPPVAKFKYTVNDCSNKLQVTFIDSSIAAITYSWDFGDGDSSNLINPVHIYATSGVYNVTLKVTNGSCYHYRSRLVTVDNKVGILKISAYENCKNTNVNFSIDSVNTARAATYSWYINNQSSIATSNPSLSYNYTQIGSYNGYVAILYDNNCSDTLFTNAPIKIYGPTANFKPENFQYCSNINVNFIDSSSTDGQHAINNWAWNYGDGTIVNNSTPASSHTYTSAGNFSVALKVTDAFGCVDSLSKISAVSISKSVAAFIENDTLVCPTSTVSFTNQSTGNNLSYSWDFGDGGTSNMISPSHTYQYQGTYTIKLLVADPLGCNDTLIKINRIKIYNPIAKFSLSDSFAVCPPLLVNTTNTSIYAGSSTWTFGDGSGANITHPSHLYTYPGNYTVKLVVRNTGGCADSTTKSVLIYGPTGTFSYTPNLACNPVQVSFNAITQNSIKNIWDYNNGVTLATTSNTSSFTYTVMGHYIPKLILEDAQGCKVPIIGADIIKVKDVEAFIAVAKKTVCDSGYVQFVDSSITNDLITQYAWNFGDGTTSTQASPIHNYNIKGLYNVRLKVTTQTGCTDTITYLQAVKVVAAPKAIIVGDSSVCKGGSLLFTSNITNPDSSAITWYWSFGNGNTSTLQNPPIQAYTISGNSNLINIATNSSGCADTTIKTIRVREIPVVDAGVDTAICRNTTYTLQATGANTYTWVGNTTTLSCTNCAVSIAKPLTNITYKVVGKSEYNCVASDSITIRVQQPLKITVDKGDTLCLGETAKIKALGSEKYTWFPTLYVDNAAASQVNIRPANDTLINYMVIGKDNKNCFADTGFVKIKTYPIPKFEIKQDEITLNAGSTIKLQTTNSADITKWKWTPAKHLDNANLAQPTAIAKESITYVCVAANEGQCVGRDEVKIIVVCNSGNIFMPNTFSPNADGVNDVFYPRGKGLYSIKNLRIFNRWGEVVFERTNFQANDINSGWDGTSKGAKLPSDAYVYSMEILCDNSTIVPSKGSITLLR